jgi:hypothetical protein
MPSNLRIVPALDAPEPSPADIVRCHEEAARAGARGLACDFAARAKALTVEAESLARLRSMPVGIRELARRISLSLEVQAAALASLIEKEAAR